MPSTWDANANTNLLISINEIQNPKPPNWKEVAEKMAAKGYVGFTHEACRQHYQKLRKDAKNASEQAGSSAPAKAATPRKRGAKTVSSFTTGDDDEEVESPTKKRKGVTKAKKTKVEEGDDGNSYEVFGAKVKIEKSQGREVDSEDGSI